MRMSLRLKIALGLLLIPTLVATMLFILITAAFRDVGARTQEAHATARREVERYREAADQIEGFLVGLPDLRRSIQAFAIDRAQRWLDERLNPPGQPPMAELDTREQKQRLRAVFRGEVSVSEVEDLPFAGFAVLDAHLLQANGPNEAALADGQNLELLPVVQGGAFSEEPELLQSADIKALVLDALEGGEGAASRSRTLALAWPTNALAHAPAEREAEGEGNQPQARPDWIFLFYLDSSLPPEVDALGGLSAPEGRDELGEAPIDSYVTAIAATISFGALLFLGMLMFTVQRVVMRPLESLVSGSRRIASGDYSLVLHEPGGEDEMSRLIRAFNHMQSEIRKYQREMQQRIREATERIREQERSLVVAQRLAATGTLAAGLAHEINNPLGGMLNAVRRIQKTSTDERALAYCELIQEGVERIQALMGSVLDFSRRRDTKPHFFDLRHLLERSAEYVRYRFKGGAELEVDLPDELPKAYGDENGIGQVIVNLLLNARDALRNGNGKVSLRARALDTRSAEIVVSDDGEGMDDETKRRIFDPFFTTKEVGKGTGLGLSIVHTIVSNHEGVISVDSAPDGGTVFTVTLPLITEEDVAALQSADDADASDG